MRENASTIWNGRERRTNLRLRELLNTINEQLAVQSVQIARLRVDVDELKKGAEPKRERVVDE